MNVRQLTVEQKDLLVGQIWGANGQLFNPQLDVDGNWFISQEEVDGCVNENFTWVNTLPFIVYNPIISELPGSGL